MSPRTRSLPRSSMLLACVIATAMPGCARMGPQATLADLHDETPDLEEVEVDDGLAQAMEGYRQFLKEAPESALTPEAMRRLADLAIEQSYGSLGGAAPRPGSQEHRAALPRPALDSVEVETSAASSQRGTASTAAVDRESREAFEARASADGPRPYADIAQGEFAPDAQPASDAGPIEAIALYDQILAQYPNYPALDQVLYQKTRALDELGRVDEAVEVANRLIAARPNSRHVDELLFRRGEYHFVRRDYFDAETSYAAIVELGPASEYYELALYKLGWSFYKQMFLEEALQSYVTLLDHKVATEYDFDQTENEAEAQRIIDTYRVISLCFSELGGAEAIARFFDARGPRTYEHRIYEELGEFFLDKLRYADAASTYGTFVERNPLHAVAPRFGMRIVEIYEAGDFPRLVLEAKRSFAENYGVSSPYWQTHDLEAAEEVLAYLETNLRDLATHAHALYQAEEEVSSRPAHFEEAARWYREYLASFATGSATPGVHRRFADLLLEDERFSDAAQAFETVAYGYPLHDQAADSGYAAVYARRQGHEGAEEADADSALRAVVDTSLRFATTFPEEERAAPVLGAAAEDLYLLGDHPRAIEEARRLIDTYPETDPATLRAAWLTAGHASFDSELFAESEEAYLQVIAHSSATDEDVTDNLAAAIYKQGEHAKAAGDPRSAADHFLRIGTVAPGSKIQATAEYDAAAALVELEDWDAAAGVLEAFRTNHADHPLQRDATRQMAHVRQSAGELGKAAAEYERIANEAESTEERLEALSVAGALHDEAGDLHRALGVLGTFVTEYTGPLERLVVTRFKMAEIHGKLNAGNDRQAALRQIVALDAEAGSSRTPRIRGLAAQAALELAEPEFTVFSAIELTQPFDRSLARKQQSLEQTLARFESLVEYGVGDVTAAATYYIAESYGAFGQALLDSERPGDLTGGDRLDYEDILEEQAFPFEEKAIQVHEKNLELARTGLGNRWIEKSLSRLAAISPGRYAKQETSAGPLDSIDRYVYRAPAQPGTGSPAEPAASADLADSTIEPTPSIDDDSVVETESATPPPASPALDAGEAL